MVSHDCSHKALVEASRIPRSLHQARQWRWIVFCVAFMSVLLSISQLPTPVSANSNVGPNSCCANGAFVPSHGSSTFSTAPHGYSFVLSSATWTANQVITVTLQAVAPTAKFMGHLIGVIDSAKKFQGTFAFTGTVSKYACTTSGTHVAITQTANKNVASIAFTWTAPSTSGLGTLTMTSTIIQSLNVFWKVQISIPEATGGGTTPAVSSTAAAGPAPTSTAGSSAVASSTGAAALPAPVVPSGKPSPPLELHISAVGAVTGTSNPGQNIVISWNPPSNVGSPPFTTYLVQYNNGQGGTVSTKFNVTSGMTSATLNHLTSGRTYLVQVVAYVDGTAQSLASNQLSILVASPSSSPPSPPTIDTASVAPTDSSVAFGWTAPTINGCGFILYSIEQKLASDPTASYAIVSNITDAATLNSQFDSLSANTAYSYRIRTWTTAGYSSYSTEQVATTTTVPTNAVDSSSSGSGSSTSSSGASSAIMGTGCPNDCSGYGFCTSDNTCLCDSGYLHVDCSVKSVLMTRMCSPGNAFCLDFAVVAGVLYGRIQADLGTGVDASKGYTSISFTDAAQEADGMTGSTIIVFTVSTPNTVSAINYQCSGLVAPEEDDGTVFDATTSVGSASGSQLDVSFSRALQTSNTADVVIPSQAGTISTIGWANNAQFFSQHDGSDFGRGLCRVDWVAGKAYGCTINNSLWYLLPLVTAVVGAMFLAAAFNFQPMALTSVGDFFLRKRPSTQVYKLLNHCLLKAYSSSANTASTGVWMQRFDVLTFSIRPTLRDVTFGDCLLFTMYAVGTGASIAVGFAQYADTPTRKHYVFAHLASLQFALVFLPITRNSIWTKLCGLPYERAIKFHRWMGRICVIEVGVHMGTMMKRMGSEVLSAATPTLHGHGTVYGTISFFFMLFIIVASFEPIRRRYWEAFFVSHLMFIPCVIMAVWHDTRVLYYLSIPLGLYFFDTCIRFYRSYIRPWKNSAVPEILSVAIISSEGAGRQVITKDSPKLRRPAPRVVRLELRVPGGFHFEASDYAFLNISTISPTEWHPFSFSNAPNDPRGPGVVTFHILDFGFGSWTAHLAEQVSLWLDEQKALTCEKGVQHRTNDLDHRRLEWSLPLLIDGPYGKVSLPLNQYGCIVLAAGGIGITPMMSMLQYIVDSLPTDPTASTAGTLFPKLVSIHLVWTCRSATSFETWFPELLSAVHPAYKHILHLHLFYTILHKSSSEKPIARSAKVEAINTPPEMAPGAPPSRSAAAAYFTLPQPKLRLGAVEDHMSNPPLPASMAGHSPPTVLVGSDAYRPDGYHPEASAGQLASPSARSSNSSRVAPAPVSVPRLSLPGSNPPPPPPNQSPAVPAPASAAKTNQSASRSPPGRNGLSPPQKSNRSISRKPLLEPLSPPSRSPLTSPSSPPPVAVAHSPAVPPLPGTNMDSMPDKSSVNRGPGSPGRAEGQGQSGWAAHVPLVELSDLREVVANNNSADDDNGGSPAVAQTKENETSTSSSIVVKPAASSSHPTSGSDTLHLINGRPCFPELFDAIQADFRKSSPLATNQPIAVMACGPDDLVLSVQKAAMERNWHLHKETFLF